MSERTRQLVPFYPFREKFRDYRNSDDLIGKAYKFIGKQLNKAILPTENKQLAYDAWPNAGIVVFSALTVNKDGSLKKEKGSYPIAVIDFNKKTVYATFMRTTSTSVSIPLA